jgi:peptide/nickel transport system substrate-binding protein
MKMSRDDRTGLTLGVWDCDAAGQPRSRRAFLRGVAGLGLALPIGGLLAACGGDDESEDENGDATEPADSAAGESTPTAAEDDAAEDGEDSEEGGSGAPGGQAIISSLAEPATLFSGLPATGAVIQQVLSFIANGLTKLSHPEMEVTPDIAESWEVSDDARVYTFTLRQDVTFHDGGPLTANDVKFTYDLVTHSEWPGGLDPYFAVIEGAAEHKEGAAEDIAGITVLDDYQIEFTFSNPDVQFLALAAVRQRILPKHILENEPPADIEKGEFPRKPIYTGPFKVDEWRTGESITFSAYPEYFAGPPNLDGLVVRFIPDPATAIAELRSGAVHLGLVTPDQFASFTSDATFKTQQLAGSAGRKLQFDLTKPMFSDPRLRQAMSHAIDRETIIEALYLGLAEPNHSQASPLSWVYNPDAPKFPYDPDRAAELLDEAGWTLDDSGARVKDGEQLAFTIITTPTYREDALAIQPFLQEVGIEAEIEEQGAGQASGPLEIGQYEATMNAWFNFIIDPRADLQRNFESPRPLETTGYSNEQVNELFDQARSETDPANEKELYDQIQEIAEGDAPWVYTWRLNDLLVVHQDLIVPEVSTQTELYTRLPEWSLQD